ncbi:MAG: hypothetical protein NVSMB2_20090 [Chloroflexota bacterium]
MTLATLLQPWWLAALVAWSFAVLAAAQLTIRLIMAFSVRLTIVGAVLLAVVALVVASMFDLVVGPHASIGTRLAWIWLPMLVMGVGGFAIARWQLRIKRLRGQLVAAVMVGLLDPHLFTVLFS